MSEWANILTAQGLRLRKTFRETEDHGVYLAEGEGIRVCRIYRHPATAYAALVGEENDALPTVYRYNETEDGAGIVEEEYVDGANLSELLEVYRPDDSQTVAIVRRLCGALNLLHRKGFIHRDIKPENILVTSAGRVVLLDLDAASAQAPEKDRDTRLLGTVGYAAPEQFGFGRSDVRTDIFALGVLMNTLRTGSHPSSQLAEGALRPVIETCIAVNADQRYESVEALLAALPPETKGEPCPECGFVTPGGGCLCCGRPSGTPIKLPTTDRQSGRKGKIAAIAVAAVAVIALLAAVLGRGGADAVQQFPHDSLPNTDPVEFQYDLDGDGTTETYYFAPVSTIMNPPTFIWSEETDRGAWDFAPAVWEKGDNGGLVPVDAFADLLADSSLTLWNYDAEGKLPSVENCGLVWGLWPGGKHITLESAEGNMVIEAKATLDGQEFRAYMDLTQTAPLPEVETDPNGPAFPPQASIEDFPGEEIPSLDPMEFQYDLDGDGTEETYYFGVLGTFEDVPIYIREDVCVASDRQMAPAVWRLDENEELAAVDEFAPLLEDGSLTVWNFSAEGDEPNIEGTGLVYGVWPFGEYIAMNRAVGIWIYEAKATLDGQELVAYTLTDQQPAL